MDRGKKLVELSKKNLELSDKKTKLDRAKKLVQLAKENSELYKKKKYLKEKYLEKKKNQKLVDDDDPDYLLEKTKHKILKDVNVNFLSKHTVKVVASPSAVFLKELELPDVLMEPPSFTVMEPPSFPPEVFGEGPSNTSETILQFRKQSPVPEKAQSPTISAINNSSHESEEGLTQKGLQRKRRKFKRTQQERKASKWNKRVQKHLLKEACSGLCKAKSCSLISVDRRKEINSGFWKLNAMEQKYFIYNHTSVMPPKRRRSYSTTRSFSTKYTFSLEDGSNVIVCKKMFLTTLGFSPQNDKIVRNVLFSKRKPNSFGPKKDERGRQPNPHAFDVNLIKAHIQTFGPTISHYRREHAPNTKYLPSDISIVDMHKDFVKKHEKKPSYELYRNIVASENISFAKLGHEECWSCAKFEKHKKLSGHSKESLNENCDLCKDWQTHDIKYTSARQEYKKDASQVSNEKNVVVSADLQKVIMLPRCDMFKEVIFLRRIIAFNETFAPLGKNKRQVPIACIWHEAISGREKEDIISTFNAFIKRFRDAESFTFWLDNCSSQNKNWALFSFFIYIVNSPEFSIKNIVLKYFEPGHTFMSADAFHHQVEQGLKKKKKVYDFDDFKNVVRSANSNKVDVIEMKLENFYIWPDYSSALQLKKVQPRAYLNNMSLVTFTKGDTKLKFKNKFEEENYQDLDFLKVKVKRSAISAPPAKVVTRGISLDRKTGLVEKLKDILPPNRMEFWENLPVN